MNIPLLLLLYSVLNYYYWKHSSYFLQKLLGFIISFFYFLEYIFIFLLINNYIYIMSIYRFIIKEKFVNLKKKRDFYTIRSYRKINNNKNEINNKNKIIYKFLRFYNKRWMFYGLSVVYIQIFIRKIREGKNYLIYYYYYKLKRKYFLFKNVIMRYSLFFYFFKNYNLIIFLENKKNKLFNIIVILSFIKIFLKNKILFYSINYIKKLKWKNS